MLKLKLDKLKSNISKLPFVSMLTKTHVVIISVVLVYVAFKYFSNQNRRSSTAGKRLKTLKLYHSPKCIHCVRLMPVWNELVKKHSNNTNIKFVKVDCLKNRSEAESENITGFPTIILFNGDNKTHFTGVKTLENLEKFIR